MNAVAASLAALAMVLSCSAAPPPPTNYLHNVLTNASGRWGTPNARGVPNPMAELHWTSPVKERVVTFPIEPHGKAPELMSVFVASDKAQVDTRKRQEEWQLEFQTNRNLPRTKPFPFLRNSAQPDFSKAEWVPFKTNVAVDLGPGDGGRWLWVSFKNRADANPYWESCRIVFQGSPPIIGITNPKQTITAQPVIQLQGFLTTPLDGAIKYELLNQDGAVARRGEGLVKDQYYDRARGDVTTNYFWCYDVKLSPGTNTFVLHAKDRAGYSVTTNCVFVFTTVGKTNPPVFKLEWPLDGTIVSGTKFDLHGACDDPTANVTALICDDQGNAKKLDGFVERNGCLWVEHVPLAAGISYITIVTSDAAQNSSLTNITLGKSQYILSIDRFADPKQLWQPQIRVTGYYSRTNHSLLVNGVRATMQSDGHWVAENVPVNSPNGGATASFQATADPDDERMTPSHGWQPSLYGEPTNSIQAGISFVAVGTNEYNHYGVCVGITNLAETNLLRNWMLPSAESRVALRLVDKAGKALPTTYGQKSEEALPDHLNIHRLGKKELACLDGVIPLGTNMALQLAGVNLDGHFQRPPPGDYRLEVRERLFQMAEDGRLIPITLPPVMANISVIDQPSEMTFILNDLATRRSLSWGPALNSLRVGVAHNLSQPRSGKGVEIQVFLENLGTNIVRNLRLPRIEEQFDVSLLDAAGAEVRKTALGRQRGLPLTIPSSGGATGLSREVGALMGLGDPRRSALRLISLAARDAMAIGEFNLSEFFDIESPGKYRLMYQQKLYQLDSSNKLTGLSMPQVVVPIDMP